MGKNDKKNKTPRKTLIVVRHAHREKDMGREVDNGLSGKGRKQAERIRKLYQRRYDQSAPHILSSAKVRCVETVMPIANLTGAEVHTSDWLMEKDGIRPESEKAFRQRVLEFLEWWKRDAPELTVACSHGDWIPEFFVASVGAAIDLAKGGWAELGLKNGDPTLELLLQDPSAD